MVAIIVDSITILQCYGIVGIWHGSEKTGDDVVIMHRRSPKTNSTTPSVRTFTKSFGELTELTSAVKKLK